MAPARARARAYVSGSQHPCACMRGAARALKPLLPPERLSVRPIDRSGACARTKSTPTRSGPCAPTPRSPTSSLGAGLVWSGLVWSGLVGSGLVWLRAFRPQTNKTSASSLPLHAKHRTGAVRDRTVPMTDLGSNEHDQYPYFYYQYPYFQGQYPSFQCQYPYFQCQYSGTGRCA